MFSFMFFGYRDPYPKNTMFTLNFAACEIDFEYFYIGVDECMVFKNLSY